MTGWRWCVVGLFMLVGGLLAFEQVRTAGFTVMSIGLGFWAGNVLVARLRPPGSES